MRDKFKPQLLSRLAGLDMKRMGMSHFGLRKRLDAASPVQLEGKSEGAQPSSKSPEEVYRDRKSDLGSLFNALSHISLALFPVFFFFTK